MAVYAAELAAFDGTDLEAVRGVEPIASVVSRLTSGSWWTGPAVEVVAARRDASSSSTHGPLVSQTSSTAVIRLSSAQATVATAAHELAHALAGVGHGHDHVFRRAYLDVVAVITNLDPTDRRSVLHVQQLADSFAAAGLDIGERAWPPPDPSIVEAIAL